MIWRRTTKVLIWTLTILASMPLWVPAFVLGTMKNPDSDQVGWYNGINFVAAIAVWLGLIVIAMLTLLLIWSFWRTWQDRQRG